jgi:hypothetical protein
MPTRFVPRRLAVVVEPGVGSGVVIGGSVVVGGGTFGFGVEVGAPVGAGVGDVVVGAGGVVPCPWRWPFACRESVVVTSAPKSAGAPGVALVPSMLVVSLPVAGDAPQAVTKDTRERPRIAVARRVH